MVTQRGPNLEHAGRFLKKNDPAGTVTVLLLPPPSAKEVKSTGINHQHDPAAFRHGNRACERCGLLLSHIRGKGASRKSSSLTPKVATTSRTLREVGKSQPGRLNFKARRRGHLTRPFEKVEERGLRRNHLSLEPRCVLRGQRKAADNYHPEMG